MSNETSQQIDKWVLSPPGGPAGPFWGIVAQSGRVIAFQIVERQHAEILRVVGNLLAGDYNTARKVEALLSSVFDETLGANMLPEKPEDYFVNAVIEAILGAAQNE